MIQNLCLYIQITKDLRFFAKTFCNSMDFFQFENCQLFNRNRRGCFEALCTASHQYHMGGRFTNCHQYEIGVVLKKIKHWNSTNRNQYQNHNVQIMKMLIVQQHQTN